MPDFIYLIGMGKTIKENSQAARFIFADLQQQVGILK
jgi:hypothetical protein